MKRSRLINKSIIEELKRYFYRRRVNLAKLNLDLKKDLKDRLKDTSGLYPRRLINHLKGETLIQKRSQKDSTQNTLT